MRRSSSVLVLLPLWLLACGGSSPPAQTADDAAAAEPTDTASEPGAGAPASDEAWEGEAEATRADSSASSASDSGAGQAAPPDTKGEETRTTEVIAKVVQGNRKPFRDCFEKGKKEIPTLKGMMTLHFVLDPEGNVKLAELSADRSDIKSPLVVDCSIAVLKGMKFPPSSRGMESTINYPFNFN